MAGSDFRPRFYIKSLITNVLMKIGIDGFRLSRQFKGDPDPHVKLISDMADYFPETDFLIYVTSLSVEVEKSRLASMHNIRFCLPAPSGFSGEMWRKFGITNNLGPDKVDLYHGICDELPLNINEAGVKAVLTLTSDLTKEEGNGWINRMKRKMKEYIIEKSVKKADLIIVPDDLLKSRIAENYVISPHKIKVIAGLENPKSYSAALMNVYREIPERH